MNKGISPIIGTILMVAIVVALAMSVYIYFELTKEKEKYVEGWVVDAYHIHDTHINGKDYMVWNVTLSPNYQDLENGTSYLVLFPKNDTPAPPPEDVKIRIYYKETKLGDKTALIAYRVKSL
ncbi:MAG: hypothetical protein DRP18_01535 [Candidatus Aenigmatarchaeota archaeon]|nr:MAG: hypothetical protein DRP18_01535 [Candidatus Aenigmarchaeota archaeon]HDD57631.1 hypothetical protein [Thermoplasmatales archaeon]